MVFTCCAHGCKERWIAGGSVTFHSFPKDEERRKLWVSMLRRENFKVSDHTKICSKHFLPESFNLKKFGGTWLKDTAVPTVFDFPAHLQPKITKERTAPIKRTIEEVETPSEPELSIPKRKYFIGDFDEQDMASPTKACHVLNMAKCSIARQRKKIKTLRQRNKRLKKMVRTLKEKLSKVKKKNLKSLLPCDVLQLQWGCNATEIKKEIP